VLRRAATSLAPSNPAGPGRPLAAGATAPRVEGVAPDGSTAVADTRNGPMSLVFLTSECRECEAAWGHVAARPDHIVIVTPGPETESARRIARLSTADASAQATPDPSPAVTVVMSSETWHAYGVTKAPWVIHIDGGLVVSSAPATF
jgi:hypothetical protein